MSKILVAGAGHGGVVAAMKLSQLGHTVKIIEKETEDSIGLSQMDSFDVEAMEFAGIEIPQRYFAPRNQLTFVPLDPDVSPVTLPVKEEPCLIADRKDLIGYLLSLAKDAGVEVSFGVSIFAPIVLGSRVVGAKTSEGDEFADLVIDACGVHSPLRTQLPDFMDIQKKLPLYDLLHTYRAYFERVPGSPDPATDYNVYLKNNGTIGFSWLVTEKDKVDVLIGRFPEFADGELASELHLLNEENEQMGTKLLRGGSYRDIPVRQPLAVFVADGYAAVGDSACMTYPVKGSGISYSLKAGTMLAEAVEADTDGLYNTETLWEYEKQFYKKVGNDACKLALLKNLLPYVSAQEVSDLMGENIITTEDLVALTSDKLATLLNARGIAEMRDKLKSLSNHPDSRKKLLNLLLWFGKLTMTEPFFPNKYDRLAVHKWAEKYNEFYNSIRFSEEVE